MPSKARQQRELRSLQGLTTRGRSLCPLRALTVATSRFRAQAGRVARIRPVPSARRRLALGHSPQGLPAFRLRRVVAALPEIRRRARALPRPDLEPPGLPETR
jgi:hypothetical protein